MNIKYFKPSHWLSILLFLAISHHSLALPENEKKVIEGTANPNAKPAVDPEKALLSTVTYPKGMTADVFAREPNVQDPTAITIDEKNRIYIAETHRFDRGIEDNRRNGHWVFDDYRSKTTADRLAMYKKYANKKPLSYFTQYSEKIRVIEDTTGDGKADTGKIFAEGFNDPLDGTAAGVMALDGKIYFACIPHVWMLEDTDDDQVADKRKSLQEGYGISVSLSGHDLNGFALGPDNRIYFTIGDRGYNLKTKEGKHLKAQYEGAAFRMERDGSNLEVVHTGLRNPKEVAFDKYGNLFSVDNNADLGDKARVVDIIEGAHSGWHRSHQAFTHFTNIIKGSRLGRHSVSKWMAEGQWDINNKLRPKAILQASGFISGGPSGLAYNPGTGLSQQWDNHFFICDFVGTNAAVIGFRMEPDGAGFKIERSENFVTGLLNTDIEFGYDGKAYVSDYVGSWPTHGFGTIYTFYDKKELAKPETKEIRGLFAKGFDKLDKNKLAALLRHPDMRVRLRAQLTLAKDISNTDLFIAATKASEPLTTRLHAVWGLGNLARLKKSTEAAKELLKLCTNPEAKVRGQAVKTLSESGHKIGSKMAIKLLNDPDPRTQMLAAIAIGKLGDKSSIQALMELARKTNDKDEFLRHGIVQGLVQIGDADTIFSFAKSKSNAVRRAIVLAFRRMEEGRIGHFLKDKDISIAVEAVQAINDRYIEDARADLASATYLLGKSTWMIDMRILNAMIRAGGDDNVRRLLKIASNNYFSDNIRSEALWLIGRFGEAPDTDPTTGKIRPIANQEKMSREVWLEVQTGLTPILNTTAGNSIVEALNLARKFKVNISAKSLLGQLINEENPVNVRLAAMKKLEAQDVDNFDELLIKMANDKDLKIFETALQKLTKKLPKVAFEKMKKILASKMIFHKQIVLKLFRKFRHPQVPNVLLGLLKTIRKQDLAIQLDILVAAKKRATPAIQKALKTYEASINKSKPLAAHKVTLEGGAIFRGRRLFFRNGTANCLQCHKVGNRGGSNAGPNLAGLASRHDKNYILESIIDPSAKLSPGYSTIALTMKDGSIISGMLMQQTDKEVTIKDIESNKIKSYEISDIKTIPKPMSTMPPMGDVLSKEQIRDLIAYLSSLKKR